jgi:hypothetical protein
MIKQFLIAASALILLSCNSSEKLDGFNQEAWIKDGFGCNNTRAAEKTALDTQKEKLLKLNQGEVIDILGKPDRQELDSRNKKLFIYFMEPGPDCSNALAQPLQMHIRFSALGISYEISYKNL